MAPNSSDEEISNPNEYLQIPKWINEDYFRHIVENELPDLVAIKKFKAIAATPPGENYTSIMVRVVLEVELKDGSTKKLFYILKTMLEDRENAKLVKDMGLFPTEIQMYSVYMPKFTELYKEAGLNVNLAPKCLNVDHQPERIALTMEDLKQRHFKNANRLQGFDMAHITCVLKKLAELHAASAVYYEQNGSYGPLFDMSVIGEHNKEMFEGLYKARDAVLKSAIRDSYDIDNPEYYCNKLLNPEDFSKLAVELNNVDPTEFNVLNHGDCWVNNIMFNYKENGDIDECLFVDLQISKWGSPAQDLWYMITGSVSLDIKVSKFDEFIQIYHEHLTKCLKLLNYTKHIPSLKELHIMMLKYSYWSIFTAFSLLCLFLLPADKDANMEMLWAFGPEGDEFRRKTMLNPYYARTMTQLLPFYDRKGILDFNK